MPRHSSDGADPFGRAEHRVADRACRRAVNGEDQHDEEQIGQLEQGPAGPEQTLEEAAVVECLEAPRDDECQRAEDAEQQRREQDRVEPAPRPARQEEFGELAARRIAAADHDRLDTRGPEAPSA